MACFPERPLLITLTLAIKLFFKLKLLHLARWVSWQQINQVQLAGQFVTGQGLTGKVAQYTRSVFSPFSLKYPLMTILVEVLDHVHCRLESFVSRL